MGDPKAFLKIHRQEAGYRPVHERITDFGEVEQTLNTNDRRLQASRCMDCGIPFCHWACPARRLHLRNRAKAPDCRSNLTQPAFGTAMIMR